MPLQRFLHPCPKFMPGLVAAAVVALTGVFPSRADDASHVANRTAVNADHSGPMSASDMDRWVTDWYAAHPPRGVASSAAAADTFRVFSFGFDTDGNNANIDTMRIFLGQSVLWKWVDGSHTVTNGSGAGDPQAGHLFDQPMSSIQREFNFQFNSVGLVRFFCRPHESFGMRGLVDVRAATDVVPLRDSMTRAGFTVDPAPNPTRGFAAFQFALRDAGRVRVEVFDVRGRRVASPVDRSLGPGTWGAAWDGRSADGDRAPAGVYLLRLTIPGATESRQVVLTR